MNHPYGKNGISNFEDRIQNLNNFDRYQVQGILAPSYQIERCRRDLETHMVIQCSGVIVTVQHQTVFSTTELCGSLVHGF